VAPALSRDGLQPADRLGRLAGEFLAAVTQQPQADQVTIRGERQDAPKEPSTAHQRRSRRATKPASSRSPQRCSRTGPTRSPLRHRVQHRGRVAGLGDPASDNFPLMVPASEGNKAETKTMLAVIESFMAAHDLPDVTKVPGNGTRRRIRQECPGRLAANFPGRLDASLRSSGRRSAVVG